MEHFRIKEISENERPMEKLLHYGVENLSNSELLAILIGSGTRNKNALSLANEILYKKFPNKELLYTSVEKLMEVDGIGLSKSSRILSGLELGKRLAKVEKLSDISITNPDTVAEYLFEHFRDSYKEEFCILLLDTKNKIISLQTVSVGTINQSLVHPREVFRHAIMRNANSIMLSHNHPSGDPRPSKEDILVTERLLEAGKYIGIPILDHLVIGDRKYVSLREKNLVRGF